MAISQFSNDSNICNEETLINWALPATSNPCFWAGVTWAAVEMMIVSEFFKAHPYLAFLFVVGGSIVGGLIVFGLLFAMRRCLRLETEGLDWGVFFLGNTERLVAVALVVWAPSYLPSFIGGWVVLKFALGWQARMSDKEHPSKEERDKIRQGSMLAMIGNVLSFAIAIAVGWVLNPDALKVWGRLPHD
jgi:hypothetical protein